MRGHAICLRLAIALATSAASAGADDREARIQKLEEQGRRLAQELERLKADLLAAKVEQKAQAEDAKKIQVTLDWQGGFRMATADKRFSLSLGGDVQFDGRFQLDGDDGPIDTFNVTRARLAAQGHVFDYYHYKVQGNFGDGKVVLLDAFVDFRFLSQALLKVGQFKIPIGNEDIGRLRGPLIENSLAGDFMTTTRDIGAELRGGLLGRRMTYWVGIFNGSGVNRTDTNDDKDLVARLLFHPWQPTANFWLKGLQAGGGIWFGDQDSDVSGGGPKTNAGTRLFTFRPGTRNVGEHSTVDVEAAWNVGPVGLAGEYMRMTQDLRRGSASDLAVYHGWYAQGSWFLTGEAAGFGRVKPARPFDPGGKRPGPGAWQLAARVGQLSAEDDVRPFITGSRAATQYVAGINWYPNQMLRVSLNWEHVAFADTVAKTASEDAILFRVQLEF